VKGNPDAEGSVKQVAKVLGDIVSLAGCTPANVGESKAWAGVVERAIQDRITFCKHLKGKQLFNAVYGTYGYFPVCPSGTFAMCNSAV
jgi:hypothetical protein